MSNMKNYLETILDCSDCYGQGFIFWGNGEDFDVEACDCNPHNLIIENGKLVA